MMSVNYRQLRVFAVEFLVALGAIAIFLGYWVALPGGPQ